mmetsp:Transcript_15098/g.20696  ORF Transcript_15098/g.20696 Transcript_15098/m.20696 type:complete len:159 (-) Transcript_15098:220-696(-)
MLTQSTSLSSFTFPSLLRSKFSANNTTNSSQRRMSSSSVDSSSRFDDGYRRRIAEVDFDDDNEIDDNNDEDDEVDDGAEEKTGNMTLLEVILVLLATKLKPNWIGETTHFKSKFTQHSFAGKDMNRSIFIKFSIWNKKFSYYWKIIVIRFDDYCVIRC